MIEYSVFRKQQLSLPLQQLKQAAIDLEKAKKQKDTNSRKEAEMRLQKASQQCADIDPAIAYLWLRATESDLETHVREFWWPRTVNYLQEWSSLDLTPRLPDITSFPFGSGALQFTFALRKPYISKDDADFYILDNPVKKEWVFKVPYMAPSQWKGALRAAMTVILAEQSSSMKDETWLEHRLQLTRLFGNEKDVGMDDERFEAFLDLKRPDLVKLYRERLKAYSDTGFLSGSVQFYTTFLDRIGLEVINPHERETGVGKLPIYFECVPATTKDGKGKEVRTTGIFTLLYMTLYGPEMSLEETEEQSAQDMKALAKGIRAMMTRYGFGAKTSSGFGVADVNWKGAIVKPEEFQNRWQEVWRE
jgi:CRISPR-associated protein Cmr2